MARLVTLFLAILVLILEVDAYNQEDLYKFFKYRRDICHLPLRQGKCGFDVEAYYYNHATKQCERFALSLCGGNPNRFPSKTMCIEYCIRYNYLFPPNY